MKKPKRQPGFAILPAAVCRAWPALSPPARAVAVALAMTLDNDKLVATPTVARLSELSGIRRRPSVYPAIKELRHKTGLVVTRRGHHRANAYSWEGQEVTESVTSDDVQTLRKTYSRGNGKRNVTLHYRLDSLSKQSASQKNHRRQTNGCDEIARLYDPD